MKINLLPMDTMRPNRPSPRLLAAALAAFVLVSGMGYGFWSFKQQVTAKRAILAELQATYATLRPIEAKVYQLEQARQRLQQAETAKAFLVQPLLVSELLVELTQLIPQEVVIRSVSVAADGSVQIRCQGPVMGSAARLLAQIGQSKHLTATRVTAISNDGSGYVFDLVARLAKGGVGS